MHHGRVLPLLVSSVHTDDNRPKVRTAALHLQNSDCPCLVSQCARTRGARCSGRVILTAASHMSAAAQEQSRLQPESAEHYEHEQRLVGWEQPSLAAVHRGQP